MLINPLQQVARPAGHAHDNEHVPQFRFEKEPQEEVHQKGWAKFDLRGTFSSPLPFEVSSY